MELQGKLPQIPRNHSMAVGHQTQVSFYCLFHEHLGVGTPRSRTVTGVRSVQKMRGMDPLKKKADLGIVRLPTFLHCS